MGESQNPPLRPLPQEGHDCAPGTEEQIFTVTWQALRLFCPAQAASRTGGRLRMLLRELGQDLATEKPVVIKDGRFGPYITDGADQRHRQPAARTRHHQRRARLSSR